MLENHDYELLKGDIKYLPLAGANLGSGVRIGTDGKMKFTASQLKSSVVIAELDESIDTHTEGIFGESHYTNTKSHFKWEVGGALKVKIVNVAAASGRVRTSSDSSRNFRMTYYYAKTMSLERLNLDALTMNQLIESLETAPRKLLLKCFQAQKECIEKIKDKGDYEKHSDLIKDWRESVALFHKAYGHDLIIGVIWGGLGLVETNMKFEDEDNKYNYFIKGSFAAAGPKIGGSIEANFNWGESKATADVSYSAKGISYGRACHEIVRSWMADIYKDGREQLKGAAPLNVAATLPFTMKIPDYPKLDIPEKNPGVADAFGKIQTKGQAEALIWAQGYDKWKNEHAGDDVSIAAYEQYLTEQANARQNPVQEDADDDFEGQNNRELNEHKNVFALENERLVEKKEADDAKPKLAGNYVPLGVYTIKWADLFPCLSHNFYQGLSKEEKAGIKLLITNLEEMERLQTLKTLYGFWAATKGKLHSGNLASDKESEYSVALFDLQNGRSIADALSKMTPSGKAIYNKWKNTAIFSKAELAFGAIAVRHDKPKENWEIITQSEIWKGASTLTYLTGKPNVFNGKNYGVAFRDALKFLPIIDADQANTVHFFTHHYDWDSSGRIDIFPDYLSYKNEADKIPYTPFPFEYKEHEIFNKAYGLAKGTKQLFCDLKQFGYIDYSLVMIPIPLSALEGIEHWQGTSFTSDVRRQTSEKIDEVIHKMKTEEGKVWEVVGLDDEHLQWETEEKDGKEVLDATYLSSFLWEKSEYIGLIPRPPSI